MSEPGRQMHFCTTHSPKSANLVKVSCTVKENYLFFCLELGGCTRGPLGLAHPSHSIAPPPSACFRGSRPLTSHRTSSVSKSHWLLGAQTPNLTRLFKISYVTTGVECDGGL